VFKVAAFDLDARVKTSLTLFDCPVSHSLVKFVPCRHSALTQLQHTLWLLHIKSHFWAHFVWYYQNDKQL